MQRPLVIAEIGCNHLGDVRIAEEMVHVAANTCGVDIVKFQKRNPRESLTPAQYAAPHPVPENSYGPTYGAHREALEFPISVHRRLKERCEEYGVIYSTSVWDMTSAREVVALNPQMIKVASACNTHFPMLDYLCTHFEGEIHLSLGMTTQQEEERIIDFLRQHDRLQDTVLYACVSGYPVPFSDLSLLEVKRLHDMYGGAVKGIGFSGHHHGIAADIAAMTLGAQWIERHFTFDRTWKGTDHAASLEPDTMAQLVSDLRDVSEALHYKRAELLPIEVPQRAKMKQVTP